MAKALVEGFRTTVGSKSRLEEVLLVPSGGGCFELSVDGQLIHSKLETGRFIEDADALRLVMERAGGK